MWYSLENYAKLLIELKSDKENDVKAPLKRLKDIVSWKNTRNRKICLNLYVCIICDF